MKKNLVQKFGGTSIGTAERMLNAYKIVKEYHQDYRLMIVLSATSSHQKSEGTTSRLLEALNATLINGPFFRIIDHITQNHYEIIKELFTKISSRENIKMELETEMKNLKSFLEAIQLIDEVSPKSRDYVISTGERLSARIFAAFLNEQGIDAQYVDLSNIVKKATATDTFFYKELRETLQSKIQDVNDKIPVFTGFMGTFENGILETIGRGYTDFTATMLAVISKAHKVQIWKEVDGMYSADPRKVKTAKVIEFVAPQEAAELTYYGSEILHPLTMEKAIEAKIPVEIKNTFYPHKQGTIIDSYSYKTRKENGAIAISCKKNISIVNVESNRMLLAFGFMAKLFDIFRDYCLVIDLISTSEVHVSLTLESKKFTATIKNALMQIGKVTAKNNMSIISLVGVTMKENLGTAAKMFTALAEANINVEMISQGASEINISCVVKTEKTDNAIQILHKKMIEEAHG